MGLTAVLVDGDAVEVERDARGVARLAGELARRHELEGAVGHVESGQRLRIRVAQVGDDRVADRVDGEDVGHGRDGPPFRQASGGRCDGRHRPVRRVVSRVPSGLDSPAVRAPRAHPRGSPDALFEQPPFGDSHFAVSRCRVPEQIALDRVCNGLVTHLEVSGNAVSFVRLPPIEQPPCLPRTGAESATVFAGVRREWRRVGKQGGSEVTQVRQECAVIQRSLEVSFWGRRDPGPCSLLPSPFSLDTPGSQLRPGPPRRSSTKGRYRRRRRTAIHGSVTRILVERPCTGSVGHLVWFSSFSSWLPHARRLRRLSPASRSTWVSASTSASTATSIPAPSARCRTRPSPSFPIPTVRSTAPASTFAPASATG